MTTSTKPKQTLVGIALVRLLAYQGTASSRQTAPQSFPLASASRTHTLGKHSTTCGETTGSFDCAAASTPCPPPYHFLGVRPRNNVLSDMRH